MARVHNVNNDSQLLYSISDLNKERAKIIQTEIDERKKNPSNAQHISILTGTSFDEDSKKITDLESPWTYAFAVAAQNKAAEKASIDKLKQNFENKYNSHETLLLNSHKMELNKLNQDQKIELESLISSHNLQFKSQLATHNYQRVKLQEKSVLAIKELKLEYKNSLKESKKECMQVAKKEWENAIKKINSDTSTNHESVIQRQKRETNELLKKHEQELLTLENHFNEQIKCNPDAKSELRSQYLFEISNFEDQHKNELATLKFNHRQERRELTKETAEKIKENKKQILADKKNQYLSNLEILKLSEKNERKELKSQQTLEQKSLLQIFAKAQADLIESHKQQKNKVLQTHAQQLESLRKMLSTADKSKISTELENNFKSDSKFGM